MDENKKNRIITMILVTLFVGIPLIITFINPAVGGVLLFVGMIAAFRAIRLLVLQKNDIAVGPDKTDRAGKTVLIQVVDDFGRDLLPNEIEGRLAEARLKAGPRDTVVPVKFRIEPDQNNSDK